MTLPVSLENLALFCLTELAFSASPGLAVLMVVCGRWAGCGQ